MKKQLQSLSILIGLCLLFSAVAYAQTCVQVGPPAGALHLFLKVQAVFALLLLRLLMYATVPAVCSGWLRRTGRQLLWSRGVEPVYIALPPAQYRWHTWWYSNSTCSNGTAAGNNPSGNVDASGNEALVGFEVRNWVCY
jgi:hypothetical protein